MSWRRTSLPLGGVIALVVLVCSLVCSLGGGCSSAPKTPPAPLSPTRMSATVSHHVGGALVRSTTRPFDPAAGTDALAVEVRWTALERMPQGLGTVTPSARLIAAPTTTQPIAASGKLIGAVRLVDGTKVDAFLADVQAGKFGRSAEIGAARGALPADVTAVFHLADEQNTPDRRRVELSIYRTPAASGGDQMQLGLLISDPPRRERALLDPMQLGTGTKLALVVPAQLAGSESQATLALLEISRQTGPEQSAALAQCMKDLSAPPVAATQPAIPPADWAGLAAGLAALSGQPDAARPALIYLTTRTDAELCGDVALVADDATLASLAARITRKIGATPTAMDRPRLGWLLDSACFEELAGMQSAEKMPPELSALLSTYAGEAGRHAASLDAIARGLTSREQLDARVMAENLVYLEDASPAARVRAYDWLASKNLAPGGYDPLGSSKDRRAALDRAVPASAKQAPGGVK